MKQNSRVMISGHVNITEREFFDYYPVRIERAMELGCTIFVGDAPGADSMAQKYLYEREYFKVIVCHAYNSPRNNFGDFLTIGGFKSYTERDAFMTKQTSYDIAWVRPGKERSGTAKNLERRASLTK